jgi:hypothetical protein
MSGEDSAIDIEHLRGWVGREDIGTDVLSEDHAKEDGHGLRLRTAKQNGSVCMAAIDDDANQTGQVLAALLGWSQGTCGHGRLARRGRCRLCAQ